jgi:hypothetical protein
MMIPPFVGKTSNELPLNMKVLLGFFFLIKLRKFSCILYILRDVFLVLGLELKALGMLVKRYTTWATPHIFLFLVCILDRVSCFCPGLAWGCDPHFSIYGVAGFVSVDHEAQLFSEVFFFFFFLDSYHKAVWLFFRPNSLILFYYFYIYFHVYTLFGHPCRDVKISDFFLSWIYVALC